MALVITKELLGLESIKDTTSGKDLFEHAVHCVEKKLVIASITTDGAKPFYGKNLGLAKLLKNMLKAKDANSDIMSFHCILHQESLCEASLD